MIRLPRPLVIFLVLLAAAFLAAVFWNCGPKADPATEPPPVDTTDYKARADEYRERLKACQQRLGARTGEYAVLVLAFEQKEDLAAALAEENVRLLEANADLRYRIQRVREVVE